MATKSNTITVVDIIGNPANYPLAWTASGVYGNMLIVAEDGTSLLPDGTLDNFKLSRKANATPLLCLRSTDSGVTWTSFAPTFSTTTNAITLTDEPANNLVQVFYQTHTDMAVPAVNSEVLEIGDTFESSTHYSNLGGNLCGTLLNKVATSSITPTRLVLGKVYGISFNTEFKLDTGNDYKPTNNILLTVGNTNTPTVKVFPYLTRKNGKAYLNLVFKEMKYGSYLAPTTVTEASATYTQNLTYKINIAGCALDGKVIKWVGTTATSAINWSLYDVSPTGVIYLLSTGVVYTNAKLYDGDSWGDSNKFEIVDNVSTTTDDNGQTVLIGQKTVELSYFIDAGE